MYERNYTSLAPVISSCPKTITSASSTSDNHQYNLQNQCHKCSEKLKTQQTNEELANIGIVTSLSSEILFCNEACAKCHQETATEHLLLEDCYQELNQGCVEINIGNAYNSANKMKCFHGGNRDLTPERFGTHCNMMEFEYISSCNVTVTSNSSLGDVMEELCGQISYPVMSGGLKYKNLFCAICNGVDLGVMVNIRSQVYIGSSHTIHGNTIILTSFKNLYKEVVTENCEPGKTWYDYVTVSEL